MLRARLVPCLGVPPGLVLRERRGYSVSAAATPRARSYAPPRRALRLLRVPGLTLRRLAGGLLGAGVRLNLFGGEGALRRTFAAVGALP